jgi:hypothetical protein
MATRASDIRLYPLKTWSTTLFYMGTVPAPLVAALELYWIPLGVGTRVVRASGLCYEAAVAWAQRRPREALYHSALVATDESGACVIEMTPSPDKWGRRDRGVVAEGPVGVRLAGRLRVLRYEIRRWRGGAITDITYAVSSPVRVTDDLHLVQAAIDLVPRVPTPVWGRDKLGTGEMWNSNSVVAWLLASVGLVDAAGSPPDGGRAPGWDAGVVVAQRHQRSYSLTIRENGDA